MVGKRFNLLALLAGVLVILAACTGPITTPEQFAFNDVDEAEPGAVIGFAVCSYSRRWRWPCCSSWDRGC